MAEQRDPFFGGGVIPGRSANQFMFAVRMFHQPGISKAVDGLGGLDEVSANMCQLHSIIN